MLLFKFTDDLLFLQEDCLELTFVRPTTLEGDQDQERTKYINRVNSFIRDLTSHVYPRVKSFKICPRVQSFKIQIDLDKRHSKHIDNWIRFAHNHNVEVLELDFYETGLKAGADGGDTNQYYDFPLPLSDGSMVHLSECPSSSSMDVETLPFKMISLLYVNVCEQTLNLLLKNSPHLETLYIFGGGLLTNVVVNGRDTSMKIFVLMGSAEIQTISLHDFDLEVFRYNGLDVEITLNNLPKLKEVDIGLVSLGKNSKVFKTISFVASYLEFLSLDVDRERVGSSSLI